ncbi:MAG: glycosyltransferase family 2 protein [Pseudomonadota bacterium]
MKISIITVAYNSAATIAETLGSVAEQTHADIEHIVVDGLSQDATLTIVRDHGARVSRVITERDSGIYDAMNKGLRVARGDLVGFLNADDTFAHRDVVASIAAAAHHHPAAAAVYGDLVYVKQDRTDQVLRHWSSGEFDPARLRFGWMPPHPTFYVRSDRLPKLGPFNDAMRISADYDFMLRCLSAPGARAIHIPDVLVRMRAGGASNRSLAALVNKSREDLRALRENQVGGWFSLMCKNVRKLPQFL